jgi:hypothetical protein
LPWSTWAMIATFRMGRAVVIERAVWKRVQVVQSGRPRRRRQRW